jgi:hypothetical protein
VLKKLTDDTKGPLSFDNVMKEIVHNLKKHPILLLSLGMAILLLAAGTLALENLRLILAGLLLLTIFGVVAWIVVEGRKSARSSNHRYPLSQTGNIEIKGKSSVKADLKSGSITEENVLRENKTGDITIGKGAKVDGKLKTGDIKTGSQAKK